MVWDKRSLTLSKGKILSSKPLWFLSFHITREVAELKKEQDKSIFIPNTLPSPNFISQWIRYHPAQAKELEDSTPKMKVKGYHKKRSFEVLATLVQREHRLTQILLFLFKLSPKKILFLIVSKAKKRYSWGRIWLPNRIPREMHSTPRDGTSAILERDKRLSRWTYSHTFQTSKWSTSHTTYLQDQIKVHQLLPLAHQEHQWKKMV